MTHKLPFTFTQQHDITEMAAVLTTYSQGASSTWAVYVPMSKLSTHKSLPLCSWFESWLHMTNSLMWEDTTPQALLQWSLPSANKIKFHIRTSPIRSSKCSSSKTMYSNLMWNGRTDTSGMTLVWIWSFHLLWVMDLTRNSSSTAMFHLLCTCMLV